VKGWVVWALLGGLAAAGPLHEAVLRGDCQAIRQLGSGAIDSPDEKGLTPLVLAVQNNRFDCCELLLQMGANPNAGDWTALHEAALNGETNLVQLLLRNRADPNRREKQNRGTPLHVACFQGHIEVCRQLLKAGAKVNLRDNEGLTPLFHAKDQGHGELMKLLKASGAR